MPNTVLCRANSDRRHRSQQATLACSADGRLSIGLFTGRLHGQRLRRHSHSDAGDFDSNYGTRQATYDLKKLRGKNLLTRVAKSQRYCIPSEAIRTIAALVTFSEKKSLRPILAGVAKTTSHRKPNNRSLIDVHYETIQQDMFTLFEDLRIAA